MALRIPTIKPVEEVLGFLNINNLLIIPYALLS